MTNQALNDDGQGGLQALLERVRAYDGTDEGLEGNIFSRLIGVEAVDAKVWYGGGASILTSIDRALALTERMLPPGVDISLKLQTGGKYYHAEFETEIDDENGGEVAEYNRPTLPLAILAATLSALIAGAAK